LSAPKSFQLAVKEGTQAADAPQPVSFELTDADGGAQPFTANFPPEGELLLFMAAQSDDSEDADRAAAVLSLLKSMFPAEEYQLLRGYLRSGALETERLSEILEWIIEQWSGFPTKPAGGSSGSPARTGTRSTGRVRGTGSTLSVSP
jgi:hypothetical protein